MREYIALTSVHICIHPHTQHILSLQKVKFQVTFIAVLETSFLQTQTAAGCENQV